ncbi:MAG: ribonuclease T [Porticoccaceae bacterium]
MTDHFENELDELNIAHRFRGFLPVVVDVETGGFDHNQHALLEIAAVTLVMNDDGELELGESVCHNIIPDPRLKLDQAALDFTGINPDDPDRIALTEAEGMRSVFQVIRQAVKQQHCTRAVMVAHNAHFDLGFVNAAAERCDIKRNPFHPFTCFDTATLAGLAFGQTVLGRACKAASIPYSNKEAHSALYDTRCTAQLFCNIVNRWRDLGGWPGDNLIALE